MRNARRILVKNRLGDMGLRKINIKIELKETGCERVNWAHLAQERRQWQAVMGTLMNIAVP
jgi:hypothetical protein